MSVVQKINQDDMKIHQARTLWGADGRLLQPIETNHIFYKIWHDWNHRVPNDGDPQPWSGQLPSAQSTSKAMSNVVKPVTRPINVVPLKMPLGGYALMFGDETSQTIFRQWGEKIDSYPDYLNTMNARGRYTGRLGARAGV